MKSLLSFTVLALGSIGNVLAHEHERSMHPREIGRRQVEANDRHVIARNCAPEIAAYHESRKMAKRALMEKRAISATTSALQPHETTIKNSTCVTAPEVTEGPYYLNNDLVRQDLRENQGGILLELDVGVIDTSTCQPLPSALVELWHCNATGFYSGFTGSGAAAGGGGGAGGGSSKTDNLDFLRGGWETNSNGIVTFNTIYPGFYTGRAIHIHTMVHTNIQYNSNGTYTSRSGSLVHVGQMFFEETLNNQVVATSPYSTTSQQRTYNTADSILAQENSNGYNAYVDASLIGSSVSQGVLGFITLGVNSKASYSVSSENYYTGGDPYVAVTPSSTTIASVGSSSTSSRSSSTSSRASSSSSKTSSSSTKTSSTTSAASSGQTLYGQCGGTTWTGPTTCASGTCTYSNPYYSQCLP